MMISRRDLVKLGLKAGVGATLLSGVPRWAQAKALGIAPEMPLPITDPWIKELALRAVEAARSAGAMYADVRLTHTRGRGFSPFPTSVGDSERLSVGVRALVDGYWGFAASPIWQPDEMARLGREAVNQAKVMAMGPRRQIDLASVPVVHDEHWTMPVEIDPFEVSPFEVTDFLMGLRHFVKGFSGFKPGDYQPLAHFQVQEKAFASSEGAYYTQRVYRSLGELKIGYEGGARKVGGALDTLTPAGLGWELFTGQAIREQIRQLMEELKEDASLPLKPVEVGRYEVVCDAQTVATLADRTLGTATQLDRALGFEANASGTSYLNAPLEMLGRFEVGSPLLTLTANRSERGGAATVAWDDEGVRPDEFTLVREGTLEDFQTTRESAAWLVDSSTKANREIRSHGCAAAPSAINVPMLHTPNLRVEPGSEALDFDGAVASLEEGIAIRHMGVDMDFQGLNGLGQSSRVYEIKDGKRVAMIQGAGFLFRAPELWKGLVALGGEESVRRYGLGSSKGEPAQSVFHSVSAPPAVFEEFTVIDPKRKA